jgi:peptidoglycan-associated lipoprotein
MKRTTRLVPIFAALTLAMAFGACSQNKPKQDTAPESTAAADIGNSTADMDSDSGKAMGLETVHYAYDSSTIDSGAKATLKSNAKILKDNAALKIQIEGHCDERGGIQYNIALGERRANAAKAYIVKQGVNADRITTISYGKEKPIDQGHDESAWSKNRRANFRITEK